MRVLASLGGAIMAGHGENAADNIVADAINEVESQDRMLRKH